MNRYLIIFLISIGYFNILYAQNIQGIFSYGLGKNFRHSSSLKLHYVDGMTIAVNWCDMEPVENQFEFSLIDDELAWAIENKKIINLVLYAGNRSPQWIYNKGVEKIYWTRRLKEDQAKLKGTSHTQEYAPCFWDPVYLNYWKTFLTKLADKYSTHPAIGYINITGPTPKDYTTGTIIRYDEDWQTIEKAGYTLETHQHAWELMIDHYVKLFPRKPLVLAVGPLRPGGSDLRLTTHLIQYIIKKQHKLIRFLSVNLNDTWFQNSPGSIQLRNLLKQAKTQGYFFGYQMIYSVTRNDKFTNTPKLIDNFSATLQLALKDGASWIEIWHDDLILPGKKDINTTNEQYSKELKTTYRQLHH